MPNKKYIRRVPHLIGNEDKEVNVIFDIETLENEGDEIDNKGVEEINVSQVTLQPAGYPIKPLDAPDRVNVSLNQDPRLFQAYATEQWMGLNVNIDDYIFDQLLIPDFAFKIVKLVPENAHHLGSDTQYVVLKEIVEKPEFKPVEFSDIIGNTNAKEKAEIIIEYLKNPEKFGEWAPKNILFHGPPGTGKTLMARAIATAADCTFIGKKGTTLIGLHVGDGASKIHSLFKEARSHTPAIIFIDELDSIGLNRSYQSVRGDVIEIATALLAELDGLDPSDGIITIGATNGLDLLDLGLRNRFEEEIDFPIPSEEERVQMLQLFCKNLPFKVNINFQQIAKLIPSWSGRAIHEKLVKIAVHQAIRTKAKSITTANLQGIIQRVENQLNSQKPPSDIFT